MAECRNTGHSGAAEKISYALNQRLPDDIVVQNSSEIPLDWHPRHCNSRKTYEYRILNREFPMPQRRLDTWFVYRKLNIPAMCEAAEQFEGTHDFKSFCAAKTQAQTTVRTVTGIEVETHSLSEGEYPSQKVIIRVTGEGFLYNMVRIISGTLIKVGLGVYPPEHVKEILAACDRSKAGETVPAKGLFLKKIEYL